MSYSQLIYLYPEEDRIEYGKEFRNGAGTALVLWMALEKWLPPAGEFDYLLSPHRSQMLWNLYKKEHVPRHQRVVLMFTFDKAYIAQEDYSRFARDIRLMLADFEDFFDEKVNHWPEIAEFFEQGGADAPAVGLYPTSVSECTFEEWDEETDSPFHDWDSFWSVYNEQTEL